MRIKVIGRLASLTYTVTVYTIHTSILYYIPAIPVLYTLAVCSCTLVTQLIDRVSNAQIKYRLMNGHFSGGKCSRRREAALYTYGTGNSEHCASEIIIVTCRRQRRGGGEDGMAIIFLKRLYRNDI